MIKYFFYLVLIIIAYQLFNSCANPASPTGGPRDTIPPIRLLTIPEDKSINYKDQSIYMEFDERLKTDKIKDQLIITPLVESDYDYMIKKNTIKLTFEDPFADSTTFTLNFRESIQDITEGNPTKDNKFTFSTGSYIDSMSISGFTKHLLTYDTLEDVVIGLYKAIDTVTILDGSPYYFTELEEDGSFLIENIKNGDYLLYAFQDENKNLKLETANEPYGFIKDTVRLDSGTFIYTIDMINQDLSELRIMTAIASGKYFDINFNKYIADFDVVPFGNDHQFYSNLAKEGKAIRFYNNFGDIDSLQIHFTAIDSINNTAQDTLYVKFITSSRKTDEFSIKVTPEKNAAIENDIDVRIDFNKPITSFNTDSIFVQFDTTIIAHVHDSLLTWNKTRDEVTFQIPIEKSLCDTILNRRIRFEQSLKDSIVEQQQQEPQVKQQISRDQKEEGPRINRGLQLFIGNQSFLSADNDTSQTIANNYNFLVPADYGIQELKIQTAYPSYIVQLVTERFEVVQEAQNEKSIIFKNIEPGKYKIRVLLDTDNDGKWSPGNMIKQIEPEPVYIHPEILVIRADWQTSLDLTF